jgi:hypothetical protein
VPISISESLVVALPPIQSPSSRTFVELTLVSRCPAIAGTDETTAANDLARTRGSGDADLDGAELDGDQAREVALEADEEEKPMGDGDAALGDGGEGLGDGAFASDEEEWFEPGRSMLTLGTLGTHNYRNRRTRCPQL